MATPTLMLGRMVVREDLVVTEQADDSGDRALALAGQESIPRLSRAAVARQREDMLTLPGQFVPVVFTVKDYLSGFYTIDSANGTITDWDDELCTFRWQINLTRAGTESDTDVESRLSGALTRVNDFAVVGERTHAPAITHGGYWTDATVTSVIQRTGEDGVLKLYRGIGTAISPRWATTPAGYLTGRVRFTDELGRERAGDSILLPALGWHLSNGLVRVQPLSSGGVVEIAAYTGGGWRPKAWDVTVNAVSVGVFDRCTVLQNNFHAVTVRMMKFMTLGRLYVDVTLRRGHRFAEIYIQHEYGATLKIMRATAEAGSNSVAGTVVKSGSVDADNNRYIIGSARSFDPDLINGGISKVATPVLGAFIGVVAGASPQPGDTATDLQKQYLGIPSELTQGVRR